MANEPLNEILYRFAAGWLEANPGTAAAIGNTDDAPWDGVATDASIIALLKGIFLNTDVA